MIRALTVRACATLKLLAAGEVLAEPVAGRSLAKVSRVAARLWVVEGE
jgi:hypothetical protein